MSFYLMREKKAKVGHTVWFKGKRGKRLTYRVKECVRCVIHGQDILSDYLGWRMKLVKI